MARLTDSNGVLLGGLEMPLSELLFPLNEAPAAALAPADAPFSPEYAPHEIVFALRCSYGSLPTLGYSAAPDGDGPASRSFACPSLVEEPDERHFCPGCGGYYCVVHAEPATHDCRAVLRGR